MRLIQLLILIYLFPLSAWAQSYPYIRNDGAASAINQTNKAPAAAAVDANGLAPLKEATPIPMATIIPTALPTAWPTPQFTGSTDAVSTTIVNQFNVDMWCDNGLATPAPYSVPSQTSKTDNYGANGRKFSGSIRCIHPGAPTPGSGTAQIYGYK